MVDSRVRTKLIVFPSDPRTLLKQPSASSSWMLNKDWDEIYSPVWQVTTGATLASASPQLKTFVQLTRRRGA